LPTAASAPLHHATIAQPTTSPKATEMALFKKLESVVLFVADIDAAAAWYAQLLGTEVQHENAHYAFVQGPGLLIGFHPTDGKCPGGVGGTTVYWEVADLGAAIERLQAQGARLYRGPMTTSLGATAAMLLDPFGCSLGLLCPAG
jgi:predicted enzyme related to lactoylglutathione lyase